MSSVSPGFIIDVDPFSLKKYPIVSWVMMYAPLSVRFTILPMMLVSSLIFTVPKLVRNVLSSPTSTVQLFRFNFPRLVLFGLFIVQLVSVISPLRV